MLPLIIKLSDGSYVNLAYVQAARRSKAYGEEAELVLNVSGKTYLPVKGFEPGGDAARIIAVLDRLSEATDESALAESRR